MYVCVNTVWPLRKLRQSILSAYKLLTGTDNDSVQKYMAPSVTFSLGGSLTQFPVNKTIAKNFLQNHQENDIAASNLLNLLVELLMRNNFKKYLQFSDDIKLLGLHKMKEPQHTIT